MKKICSYCNSLLNGDRFYSHPELIFVIVNNKEVGFEYVYFCKECNSLLSMYLEEEELNEDNYQIMLYDKEITNDIIEHLSVAFFVNKRLEFVEERKKFLRSGLMPIFDPISIECLQIMKENKSKYLSNVILFPQKKEACHENVKPFNSNSKRSDSNVIPFPKKNVERSNSIKTLSLNSSNASINSKEEDHESLFQFAFADPIDLHISSTKDIPRYYQLYLVPADEVDTIVKINDERKSFLMLYKRTFSRIVTSSIWDEKEKNFISMKKFLSDSTSSLTMKSSQELRDKCLDNLRSIAKEKLQQRHNVFSN